MKAILTNTTDKKSGKSVWDKATLREQSTEALVKLDKSLKLNTKTKKKKVNNYAAQGASYNPGKDEGEFLYPGEVKFAKNKKKK
jgi:LDH2 family malate/lactate/ureidoglycolate dehydrogenase